MIKRILDKILDKSPWGCAFVLLLFLALILAEIVADVIHGYSPMEEMIRYEYLGAHSLPALLIISILSSVFFVLFKRLNDKKLIFMWKIVVVTSFCMLFLHLLLSYTGYLMIYDTWFVRGCESDNPPWNCRGLH